MFTDLTAVVTGAASGIGRSLAEELSARGATVHLVDVDDAVLEVAAELDRGVGHRVDVSDDGAVAELAARLVEVDVLCCNAGIVGESLGSPWLAPNDEWQRVLGVNLFGVVNAFRHFIPQMLTRGMPGHVVVTASLAGAATWPGGGAYGASKHAVLALAEQAALELADTEVSVTVGCPALVRSAMSDVGEDPRDVARQMLDAAIGGRFAVLPEEWHGAVRQRADDLAAGRAPTTPSPS